MNAMEFVIDVENSLGWSGPDSSKPYKARIAEAGKVKRKIASRPSYFSDENIALALAYCQRNKLSVRSPVGVLNFIQQALRDAPVAQINEQILEERISAAIGWEREHGGAQADDWIRRLVRAEGAARQQVYDQWYQERAGA